MPNRVMNVARKAVKSLSVKRINENTKRRNMRFQRMDRMAQRVAIARDVLNMLDSKKLRAARGVYLEVDEDSRQELCDADTLPPPAMQLARVEKCDVCAIGSMFAGLVHRGVSLDSEGCLDDYTRFDMVRALSPYFTRGELGLMEDYFEDGYSDTDDKRLRKVLETIIDTKGEFFIPADERDEWGNPSDYDYTRF